MLAWTVARFRTVRSHHPRVRVHSWCIFPIASEEGLWLAGRRDDFAHHKPPGAAEGVVAFSSTAASGNGEILSYRRPTQPRRGRVWHQLSHRPRCPANEVGHAQARGDGGGPVPPGEGVPPIVNSIAVQDTRFSGLGKTSGIRNSGFGISVPRAPAFSRVPDVLTPDTRHLAPALSRLPVLSIDNRQSKIVNGRATRHRA
jgi:hypothetical protein